MQNQLLVSRALSKNVIYRSQHGFVPGRGTLTAWKDILLNAIKAPDIYELDFKGFFDNVELRACVNSLQHKLAVPQRIANHILETNMSLVRMDPLRERWKLEERVWKEKVARLEALKLDPFRTSAYIYKELSPDWRLDEHPSFREFQQLGEFGEVLVEEYILKQGMKGRPFIRDLVVLQILEEQYRQINELKAQPGHSFSSEGFWNYFRGVPQGSPMSPFLSTMALDDFLAKSNIEPDTTSDHWQSAIGYADDWILYGNRIDPSYLNSLESGVEIAPEKSGWVKKDSQWVKPLKFLGLEFDGITLRAKTRDGASLVYDKDNLIQALRDRRYLHLTHRLSSSSGLTSASAIMDYCPEESEWDRLSNSEYMGLIQARLYQDSWEIKSPGKSTDIPQQTSSARHIVWRDAEVRHSVKYKNMAEGRIVTREIRPAGLYTVDTDFIEYPTSSETLELRRLAGKGIQNFEMTVVPRSYADTFAPRDIWPAIDVFNVTSYASKHLANWMSRHV